MDDINIGTLDRLVIDLPAFARSVRASDRSDVHPFLDPMSIEDRIPRRRSRLNKIAALHSVSRRFGGNNRPVQFPAHYAGKLPAVFFIRTVHFDPFKIEELGEIFDMRARLPPAA